MRLTRLNRLAAFAAVLGAFECGGGGGGTQPPGPPTQLVVSGGDAQSWYFNNPLPTPLSVTAQDASGRTVSGVVVTWAVTTSGGGDVNPKQSTTNASGIATTTDSVGATTIQTVSATFSGLPGPTSFTEHADPAPTATTAGVNVADNSFTPPSVGIKAGGTVTWTWTGAAVHNVTFTGGPTLPAKLTDRTSGTGQVTFTTVGRYAYTCTNHANMNGTVDVVH